MSMRMISGPYTPADGLISALGHLESALSALAFPLAGTCHGWRGATSAKWRIEDAQMMLRAALEQEPTAVERAQAHGVSLDALLGKERACHPDYWIGDGICLICGQEIERCPASHVEGP